MPPNFTTELFKVHTITASSIHYIIFLVRFMLPKEREGRMTLIKYDEIMGNPKSRHETVTGQFRIIIIKNPLLSEVMFQAICEDKNIVTNATDQIDDNDDFKTYAREHGLKMTTTVRTTAPLMYHKLMNIPRGAVLGKTSGVAKETIRREQPINCWNLRRSLPVVQLK